MWRRRLGVGDIRRWQRGRLGRCTTAMGISTSTSPILVDPNRLYRNDGTGFTDIGAGFWVLTIPAMDMARPGADYDRDGDLDLYVANFGANRFYPEQWQWFFRALPIVWA